MRMQLHLGTGARLLPGQGQGWCGPAPVALAENRSRRGPIASAANPGVWGSWALVLCLLGMLCFKPQSIAEPKPPVLPPLTTVSGSPRLPGKFVWADLVTDDVPSARAFYQKLFGWTFQGFGNYVIGANDERPLCGMFQRPRPTDKTAQPRWFAYISVPSVQRARRDIIKLGGREVSAPQKFPKRGEQAVFGDPEGAIFGVIKSSSGDPEDFRPEPGDWIWIQLLSRDAAKAAEFYRQIGKYAVVENTQSNRLSDLVLTSEGYARATIRRIPKDHSQVVPTWLPFVRVKRVNESIALAKELGGKVLVEPGPDLMNGQVAVVADPTGSAIGILEMSDDLLEGGRQ